MSSTRPFTDTPQFRVMRRLMGAANPLVRRILGGRWPGPLGRALMLLRVQGRKSGTVRTVAAGYVREGDVVVAVTSPAYRWWPNLVGGAPVEVRLAERWYRGTGRVVAPDDPAYAETVALHVRARGPRMLRSFGVPVTDDGHVPDEALGDASRRAHLVRIELEAEIPDPR